MAGSSKDTELTMCDVLQKEKELEEYATAVLGGSDDKNCSYDQGYVPRQALYACMTCEINRCLDCVCLAGVCLACCYACHDGHEVVELYTKRNFRCDCGNSKFVDKKCTLRSDKQPVNAKNKYSQNFNGIYCNCHRPYPDFNDEMFQCVVCEDWYHGRHLGCVTVPEDYYEMICEQCMQSHPFLYSYLNKYNVENGTDEPCLLKIIEGNAARSSGSAFWPENWRKELCHCSECMKMYADQKCEFLLDFNDTIQAYEDRGKRQSSQYDKGLSALNQLDRVKQMEAVRAHTSMKGQLKDYLKRTRTVGESDI